VRWSTVVEHECDQRLVSNRLQLPDTTTTHRNATNRTSPRPQCKPCDACRQTRSRWAAQETRTTPWRPLVAGVPSRVVRSVDAKNCACSATHTAPSSARSMPEPRHGGSASGTRVSCKIMLSVASSLRNIAFNGRSGVGRLATSSAAGACCMATPKATSKTSSTPDGGSSFGGNDANAKISARMRVVIREQ
jgi:hypothetical protein